KDVWTLFHSFAFDFSVWEIFGALLRGGRLVIVPREVTRSPEDFMRCWWSSASQCFNQTPSAFKQLMRVACDSPAADVAGKSHLRRRSAGRGQPEAVVRRFGDHAPQLINMYGITETTVHVTYRPITEADT
ncbi:pyoverdine sidechain peptide synthetase III, L-Thr-L-Ser component, partial [Pseudomonas savastanoi pv. glycinea str. race 4]